jgi:hypothetical protein
MNFLKRIKAWWTDRNDPFGKWQHDNCSGGLKHSGKRGHYCIEWDDLYICEDCSEFECCRCFIDGHVFKV